MNKYLNVKNIAIAIGTVGAVVGGYCLGKHVSKKNIEIIKENAVEDFAIKLVDECMSHEKRCDMKFPVIEVTKYGDLLFEISAECIGD